MLVFTSLEYLHAKFQYVNFSKLLYITIFCFVILCSFKTKIHMYKIIIMIAMLLFNIVIITPIIDNMIVSNIDNISIYLIDFFLPNFMFNNSFIILPPSSGYIGIKLNINITKLAYIIFNCFIIFNGIFSTIKYGKRKNRAKPKRKVKCIGSKKK